MWYYLKSNFLFSIVKSSLVLTASFLFIQLNISTSFASNVDQFIQKAQQNKLSEKSYWHKLLHYEKSLFSSSGLKSDVHSKDFFLSKRGRESPQRELAATIREVLSAKVKKASEMTKTDAICRFPARYKWLKKNIIGFPNLGSQLRGCSDYQKWIRGGQIKSISLMFGTGYLGNPASFFGHPILKFNTHKKNYELLDSSLNYAAHTPENENPVLYALKGVFGGYNAGFGDFQFYYHHYNYTEVDLRDVWDYQLDLSQSEVQQILDHSWEMLRKKINYYFFTDNCAYRMVELIGLVEDNSLLPKYRPYSIPNTVFNNLVKEKRKDGRPLVKKVSWIPSRQFKLTERYSQLSSDEKVMVKRVIADNSYLKSSEFKSKNNKAKYRVLDAILDFYAVALSKDSESKKLKSGKKAVILSLFQLPKRRSKEFVSLVEAKPPHKSQKSLMTRGSYLYSDSEASGGVELMVRPALYDLLSPSYARPENASLETGRLSIWLEADRVDFRELKFFSVSTLAAAKTDLPGDVGAAWQVEMGYSSQNLICRSCAVLGADVGYGRAFAIPKVKTTVYILLKGKLQESKYGVGTVAARPELGVLSEVSRSWKFMFSLGEEKFFDGLKQQDTLFKFESRFLDNPSWDIRVSVEKDIATVSKVSLSHYW